MEPSGYIAEADLDQLNAFATEFAGMLGQGDVILAYGEMGSGKTTYTHALVTALGGNPLMVSSPTYNLVHEYPLVQSRVFWHVDLYRIQSMVEADDISQEQWMQPQDGYALVEWAERLDDWKPQKGWELRLAHTESGGRSIEWQRIEQ